MNLQDLQSLIAVAQAGSFSGAAKQIYVSQPNISHHITNLEKELGVKLIERSTPGSPDTGWAAVSGVGQRDSRFM